MNKLFPLVLAILLLLGGMLWYAANNSLTQFIQGYVTNVNDKLSTTQLSLDNIVLNGQKATGNISQLTLSTKANSTFDARLTLNNTSWFYDAKSLKKSTQSVTKVVIEEVVLSIPASELTSSNQLFTQDIAQLLNHQASLIEQGGLFAHQEFNATITQIKVNRLSIILMQHGEPLEEIIATNLSLSDEQLLSEQPMGVLCANILTILLREGATILSAHKQNE